MLPLRLVIDTNVLVSAAIKPTGLQRTVFLIAITKPARCMSRIPSFEEYSEVLVRPEFRIRKGASAAIAAAHQEPQSYRAPDPAA